MLTNNLSDFFKTLVCLIAVAITHAGCAYHGAIYAHVNHAGIQIKTSQDTSSLGEVNIGSDSGTIAVVPKHDIDKGTQGEGQVGSILSRNSTQQEASLANDGQKYITAKTMVVSGPAAIAVTIRQNSQLIVKESANDSYVVRVSLPVEERVNAALSSMPSAFTPDQNRVRQLFDKTEELTSPHDEETYDAVALTVDQEFHTAYVAHLASVGAGYTKVNAFSDALTDYVGVDELNAGGGPKHQKILKAWEFIYEQKATD